jgi:hypothetical protein
LKQRFRSRTARLTILASAMAAFAVAAAVPAMAAGGSGSASASASEGATILIKGSRKEPLRFITPKTVVSGEDLTIVNDTNPKQIGPHTLSLVPESLWPETKAERKPCFTPGHICMAIAKWHGVKGEDSPPTKNPAKAGKAGWDTEGTVSKTGDSWFTGKANAEFAQEVSAAPGTTLHFICAVHPWMHGSVEVVAGS